jgi:hypothetical protein
MRQDRLILLTAISAFFVLQSAPGQGSLTPPGAPGATMLTLSQVQPRIPITSIPVAITNPGSYYLTSNLGNTIFIIFVGGHPVLVNSLAGTNAITILTNNVTIDLSGYTLTGISNALNGILGSGTNITICNGVITGFGNGINVNAVNTRVTAVTVSDCQFNGIGLGIFSMVDSCIVNNVGSTGINGATVRNSTARNCMGRGISCDVADNCEAESLADVALFAVFNANNCRGQTLGTGTAFICKGNAINCEGDAGSGTGLSVDNCAMNCTGTSVSGYGLSSDIAIGCVGTGAVGISAYLANSCVSASGDSQINYKYNMP